MHRIFMYTLLLAVSSALYAQPSTEDTIMLDDVTISVIPYHKKIKTATGAIGLVNTATIGLDHIVNIAEFVNPCFMSNGNRTPISEVAEIIRIRLVIEYVCFIVSINLEK